MGTLKDIIDTVGNLEGEVAGMISGTRHKSISKSSMDGTLNFPVIVSDALSIEDASLVSKSLERQFASFTLTLMTMNPYLYTMGGRATAANYIKKFHQNMDIRVDSTDVANAISSFMTESIRVTDVDYDSVMDTSNRIVYKIYEGVNSAGVNANNARFSYSIEDVTERAILNGYANRSFVLEDTFNTNYNHLNDNDINMTIDTSGVKLDSNAIGRGIGQSMRGSGGGNGGGRQFNHMDISSDFKKANELVPTLLHMRIYPVDAATKTELPPIDFVLGIKATLHPVSSSEMVLNIARGIKNENTFFNFIRWTTGEISFFKDFVLSLNEIKLDAINTSSKSSRWWTMLKRRKNVAKIKNSFSANRLMPNATIVITQEEMEIIRDQYGYNLDKPALAYKLMENYFLMTFVIVDPALQRVKFLFDGKNEYEVMTFAGLARENTVDDKKFKEMMNMLGRRI